MADQELARAARAHAFATIAGVLAAFVIVDGGTIVLRGGGFFGLLGFIVDLMTYGSVIMVVTFGVLAVLRLASAQINVPQILLYPLGGAALSWLIFVRFPWHIVAAVVPWGGMFPEYPPAYTIALPYAVVSGLAAGLLLARVGVAGATVESILRSARPVALFMVLAAALYAIGYALLPPYP